MQKKVDNGALSAGMLVAAVRFNTQISARTNNIDNGAGWCGGWKITTPAQRSLMLTMTHFGAVRGAVCGWKLPPKVDRGWNSALRVQYVNDDNGI